MRTEALTKLLSQLEEKREELDRRRPLSPAEAARLREYLDVEWIAQFTTRLWRRATKDALNPFLCSWHKKSIAL